MPMPEHNDIKEKNPPGGRTWQNKGVFHDFESADKLRSKILKSEKFDVKVKRINSGKFVVKERKRVPAKGKSKREKKKR